MPRLVIKEDVGLQNSKHFALLNTTQEEGIVSHYTPAFEGVHGPLMRRCIAGGDDGDTDAVFVGGVELLVLFLYGLDSGNAHHELFQGPRVVRLHNVLDFMGMKLREPFGLHKAGTQGLSDDAFWPSSYHPGQMNLTKGFAFVSGDNDVTVAACTDVFLTILWILQNARENAKIDQTKRLESGELQQVLLSPEIFSRYDDGIIQGAFLRAEWPTELDYSAHETHSASMADIILRVVQGHGFERGDASMEFITANSSSQGSRGEATKQHQASSSRQG